MIIELYETYTTEKGINLICYEQTDKYSFLCPYEITEEENVTLDIINTLVYSNAMPEDTPITAIEQMTIVKEENIESKEIIVNE